MKLVDILLVILFLVIWLTPMPLSAGQSFLARLMMTLVLFIPCAFFIGLPRRIANHFHLKKILSHPIKQAVGYLDTPVKVGEGKTATVLVPRGFSQEIGGDWSLYEHYDFDHVKVYTGNQAFFTELDQNDRPVHFMKICSLPPGYSDVALTLPDTRAKILLTYVTDDDGTNYFVSARPA